LSVNYFLLSLSRTNKQISPDQQKTAEHTLDWFLGNNPDRVKDLMNGNHKQLLLDAFDEYKSFAVKFDHNSNEMDAFVAIEGSKIYNAVNNL
jgi:hypothetical protein